MGTSNPILVVDDTLTNLRMVERILEAEGFAVMTATDGQTALRLSREGKPDLVLLDVLMPDMTGFEVCEQLKRDSATADVPILFLSALDDVDNKVKGFAAGGVDFVSKPVHSAELLARVRVHLRLRENAQAWIREQQARLNELRASLAQVREAQESWLTKPADLPRANFAVRYEALDAAGGDFYEVLELEAGVFGYFVADVSGHGASAAFLATGLKTLLRQCAGRLYTVEETMRNVDRVLHGMLSPEQYVTAIFARVSQRSGKLSLVSAGHPPALLLRRGAAAPEIVALDSDPLGIHPAAVLQTYETRWRPGDRLLLYTDGLIEARAGGRRRDGVARLAALGQHTAAWPLEAALDAIWQELRQGRVAEDDALLLAAEAP